ncbi:hypothetical protein LTR84_002894 [Exophiala bonariae]|uniref:MARVEL domain-containing protein n=1 Tax=Exophiala bonariae TaxID=1690606 RepID=A0AAV9N972_9EURO|nr:hypothetical protein LTR84_002894 [Exophiala bonariae]
MFVSFRNRASRKGTHSSSNGAWQGLLSTRLTTKAHFVIRLFQLVGALVVIGMYGTYLNRAVKADVYADGKWVRESDSIAPEFVRLIYTLQVYAVVVGSVAAVTAILFMLAAGLLHFNTVALCFAWDAVVTILWAALAGIFGSMYFNERTEMDDDIAKMKIAAGFDVANFILWLITAIWSALAFFKGRKGALHSAKTSSG